MSSVVRTSEYLEQVAEDLAQITTTPDPQAFVAAYLGHRARRRQAHFTTSAIWQGGTRRRQHSHDPLHLR